MNLTSGGTRYAEPDAMMRHMGMSDEAAARRKQFEHDQQQSQTRLRHKWSQLAKLCDEVEDTLRQTGAPTNWSYYRGMFKKDGRGWELHVSGYYNVRIRVVGGWTVIWPSTGVYSQDNVLGTKAMGLTGNPHSLEEFDLATIRQHFVDFVARS